jgi:hypothetical protein
VKQYRRIEVNAFRRRVTIVSGERPRDICDEQPAQTDDGVSLNDADLSEPVEPDSPEGPTDPRRGGAFFAAALIAGSSRDNLRLSKHSRPQPLKPK